MITICDLESFMLPVALSPGSFHKACFLFNLVLYFSMGGREEHDRNRSQGPFLSFYHMSSGDQTLVVKLYS